MAARKPKQFLELAVADDGETVKVALGDGDRLIVDFQNDGAPPARVRAPLPDKAKLLANAEYWAKSDERIGTVSKALARYINSREKELYDQVLEIRRCMKRMRRFAFAIRIAKELDVENSK